MERASIYLNFMGQTEEAFAFYGAIFGTQPTGLQRMRDIPVDPNGPTLPESELGSVMHIELEILGGTVLMGTDMLESMGHTLRIGNNTTINLELDDVPKAQRIFDALAEGATEVVPLTPQFWGAYWGVCLDRFGIRWMVNATPNSSAE